MLKIKRGKQQIREPSIYRIPLLFISLFAICGALLLVFTHASTPVTSSEAENGTVSGAAFVGPADASASNSKYVQFGNGSNAGLSISALLANFTDGSAGEALPHGVPTSYSWEAHASGSGTTPPAPNSNYIDWWGQVYVDTTDVHAANVQVELDNCQFWALANGSNTWQNLQNSSAGWGGGNYTEDFTSSNGSLAFTNGHDSGAVSVVPLEGYNAHFWGQQALISISSLQAAITVCRTRLVLANASGPDNRSSAHYILSTGADWRQSNYACPVVNGVTICDGLGVGKFIKITSAWRDAIFSTMSQAQLSSFPLPPPAAFVLPDGAYPGVGG